MNGSIDHRPDRPRPWRARYTASDRKQKSKSFKTKAEAQRWLRAEIARIDRGSWTDPSGGMQLYGEFSEKWLEGKVNVTQKTRHWYSDLLRSRVLPTFGEQQLRHIDPPTIRAWISEMVTEGLSPARVRHAHQVLRTSLQQAVDDNLITRTRHGPSTR